MTASDRFSDSERAAVYRAIQERRDMRHFIPGHVTPTVLENLLRAAHAAPSVGLMQPWRFIRIADSALRASIYEQVQEERVATAKALNEREEEFMALKVEGILDCAELLVVALKDRREQHVFGRRTMPHMDLASVACAIQNMWLAARAEGIGMGWVSLFDPKQLGQLLSMPEDSEPVAILCLGPVAEFYAKPMLEIEAWANPLPLEQMLMTNRWQSGTT